MFTRRATRWATRASPRCARRSWLRKRLGLGVAGRRSRCCAEYSVGNDKYAAGQHRGIDVALGGAPLDSAPASGRGVVRRPGADARPDRDDRDHGRLQGLADAPRLAARPQGRVGRRGASDRRSGSDRGGGARDAVRPPRHPGRRRRDVRRPTRLLPSRSAPNPPPAPATPPAPASRLADPRHSAEPAQPAVPRPRRIPIPAPASLAPRHRRRPRAPHPLTRQTRLLADREDAPGTSRRASAAASAPGGEDARRVAQRPRARDRFAIGFCADRSTIRSP